MKKFKRFPGAPLQANLDDALPHNRSMKTKPTHWLATITADNTVKIAKSFETRRAAMEFLRRVYALTHKRIVGAKLDAARVFPGLWRSAGEWPSAVYKYDFRQERALRYLDKMGIENTVLKTTDYQLTAQEVEA